jgi:hypothetical protein
MGNIGSSDVSAHGFLASRLLGMEWSGCGVSVPLRRGLIHAACI